MVPPNTKDVNVKLNGEVKNLSIWGNHSNTMFPDFYHASVNGEPVVGQVGEEWGQSDFMQTVSTRGKAIIMARGASSAASAASAAVDHMRSWWEGTADGGAQCRAAALHAAAHGRVHSTVALPQPHREPCTNTDTLRWCCSS